MFWADISKLEKLSSNFKSIPTHHLGERYSCTNVILMYVAIFTTIISGAVNLPLVHARELKRLQHIKSRITHGEQTTADRKKAERHVGLLNSVPRPIKKRLENRTKKAQIDLRRAIHEETIVWSRLKLLAREFNLAKPVSEGLDLSESIRGLHNKINAHHEDVYSAKAKVNIGELLKNPKDAARFRGQLRRGDTEEFFTHLRDTDNLLNINSLYLYDARRYFEEAHAREIKLKAMLDEIELNEDTFENDGFHDEFAVVYNDMVSYAEMAEDTFELVVDQTGETPETMAKWSLSRDLMTWFKSSHDIANAIDNLDPEKIKNSDLAHRIKALKKNATLRKLPDEKDLPKLEGLEEETQQLHTKLHKLLGGEHVYEMPRKEFDAMNLPTPVVEKIMANKDNVTEEHILIKLGTREFEFGEILKYCEHEEIRKKLHLAMVKARPGNRSIIAAIVNNAQNIARLFGFESAAKRTHAVNDGNFDTHLNQLGVVDRGIRDRVNVETERLRAAKAAHTKDSNAKIEAWDVPFYKRWILENEFNLTLTDIEGKLTVEDATDKIIATMAKIHGLEFKENKELSNNENGIRAYEVYKTGVEGPKARLGLLVANNFIREGRGNFGAGGYYRPSKPILEDAAVVGINDLKKNPNGPTQISLDQLVVLINNTGRQIETLLNSHVSEVAAYQGPRTEPAYMELMPSLHQELASDRDFLGKFDFNDKQIDGIIEYLSLDKGLKIKRAVSLGNAMAKIFNNFGNGKEVTEENIRQFMVDMNETAPFPLPPGYSDFDNWRHFAMEYYKGNYGYAIAYARAVLVRDLLIERHGSLTSPKAFEDLYEYMTDLVTSTAKEHLEAIGIVLGEEQLEAALKKNRHAPGNN